MKINIVDRRTHFTGRGVRLLLYPKQCLPRISTFPKYIYICFFIYIYIYIFSKGELNNIILDTTCDATFSIGWRSLYEGSRLLLYPKQIKIVPTEKKSYPPNTYSRKGNLNSVNTIFDRRAHLIWVVLVCYCIQHSAYRKFVCSLNIYVQIYIHIYERDT